MTSFGRGAYDSASAIDCPSASIHRRKSTIAFPFPASAMCAGTSSHVKLAIGYASVPAGFVIDTRTWAFETLDVPDATATRAFGINAGGDVVGQYVDAAGKTRGFLASRTRQHHQ